MIIISFVEFGSVSFIMFFFSSYFNVHAILKKIVIGCLMYFPYILRCSHFDLRASPTIHKLLRKLLCRVKNNVILSCYV